MPFERRESARSLELTSLIDVVFLLLIFFLVSFAFSISGDVSESKVYSDMELPKTDSQLPVIRNDALENLLIQVMPDTSDGEILRKAYVLWPSFRDTLKTTRGQAFKHALEDSTFAKFPSDFLALPTEAFVTLPACTLLTNSIRRYVAKDRLYRRNGHPIIEVRADQNTEFRILNFVMEQCSMYQDAIPQIIIRTML
ncbi:MAG: ExbD/TolR family protein [bacterium]